MSAPTIRTVRSVDIPTGPGRQTLRLSVTMDEDGSPETLVLACGFGGGDSGDPFLRPSWGQAPMALPASILPELRRALAEFMAGGAVR